MSVREEVGTLLRQLRGEYALQRVADALGVTRQAVSHMEAGLLSLSRLGALEDFYGVDFHISAVDRVSGEVWALTGPGAAPRPCGGDCDADGCHPSPRTASGLLARIETLPAPGEPVLPPREPGTGRFVPAAPPPPPPRRGRRKSGNLRASAPAPTSTIASTDSHAAPTERARGSRRRTG